VRAVVTGHGGELSLRALAGGGLAVRVSLPAAPAGGAGQVPASPAT
jgi:signal transduction histidine kinase